MQVTRIGSFVAAIALVATTAALLPAGPASAASVVVSATSVPVGGRLEASVSGCGTDPGGQTSVQAEVVTGSGAVARVAAIGEPVGLSRSRVSLTVPGWVDPSLPATVRAWCANRVSGAAVAASDAPIDVTPAAAARVVAFSLDRTSGSGGQLLRVSGSGCVAGEQPQARLSEPPDLTGAQRPTNRGSVVGGASSSGAFGLDVPLPNVVGDEVLTVLCVVHRKRSEAARQVLVHVTATNPLAIGVAPDPDAATALAISGSGCPSGTGVSVVVVHSISSSPGVQHETDLSATSDGTGAWSVHWPAPGPNYFATVTADCGDAHGSGFRYGRTTYNERTIAPLHVDAVEPSTVRAGVSLTVRVRGTCSEPVTIAVAKLYAARLFQTPALRYDATSGRWVGTLTLPDPGTYFLQPYCGVVNGHAYKVHAFAAPTTTTRPGGRPPSTTTPAGTGTGPVAGPASPAGAVPGSPAFTG